MKSEIFNKGAVAEPTLEMVPYTAFQRLQVKYGSILRKTPLNELDTEDLQELHSGILEKITHCPHSGSIGADVRVLEKKRGVIYNPENPLQSIHLTKSDPYLYMHFIPLGYASRINSKIGTSLFLGSIDMLNYLTNQGSKFPHNTPIIGNTNLTMATFLINKCKFYPSSGLLTGRRYQDFVNHSDSETYSHTKEKFGNKRVFSQMGELVSDDNYRFLQSVTEIIFKRAMRLSMESSVSPEEIKQFEKELRIEAVLSATSRLSDSMVLIGHTW